VSAPRIALLGFSIECNRFAPPTSETVFRTSHFHQGAALVAEARTPAPRLSGELPGFVATMDAGGAWEPVPILYAATGPNGPVEHDFFAWMMERWEEGLREAGRLDGLYCVLHGAGLTTEDDDPEGTLLAMARRVLGPDTPIVASFDLHANVSATVTASLNAFIGYRTNPHLDMRERGAESAEMLRQLIAGMRTHIAHVRLPIVPPTVTMLTAQEATPRPYGDMIDLGQRRMMESPYAARVLNVSVMGGFAYADTDHNGLTVIVTATDADAANGLAREIAEAGWARREQFRVALTPLAQAVALAKGTEDASKPALIFADVADNPGGGGRGNTMFLLRAFHEAGVQDALVGLIHDPLLATEAQALGAGADFVARFNRNGPDGYAEPFAAQAFVRALHPGRVVGRRGIFAGSTVELGLCAALDLGSITVVVSSVRNQCADPVFFEMLGLDIAAARVVVVKSRGHFRGGFDEFFRHDQVVEVDAPGLTSPVLSRFEWRNLPRPVIPLDTGVTWQPAP
jgi:microcystin degradation protein MlrC